MRGPLLASLALLPALAQSSLRETVGWCLVRRVGPGSNGGRWHPATDQMRGTDSYGTPCAATADCSFSVPWSTTSFTRFLFETGDGTKYLISTSAAVVGGWYANENRPILESSRYPNQPSQARWYRRPGSREDPWVSITDHGPAIGGGQIVYGENNFGSTHAATVIPVNNGANVYIDSVGCPSGITAGASGDPHLSLPHGGTADFRGQHKAIYNFLSAKNLALNVMTEMADFELHEANHSRHKDVHGSFLTQAHITARTSTGKMMRVSFWADVIGQGSSSPFSTNKGWANGTVDSEPAFTLDGPHRQSKVVDDVTAQMDYSSLHVFTPEFEIVVTPHHFRLERNVVGLHHRLDIKIKPRVAETAFAVPPHGIIGQGWDGDGKAIDGEQDTFPVAGEFTTYAMAKGAIEGSASDYRVATPYATDFKYSRFDAASAEPRDVAKLVAAGELNSPKIVHGGNVVGSSEITEENM